MRNRRSVLKMLGLSAVAAPAAAKLAIEAEAAPVSATAVISKYPEFNRIKRAAAFDETARFYEGLLNKPRGSFVCVIHGTPCFHVPDVNAL